MENKALEMPKVMSHRIETKLRPIIRIEAPQPKLNLCNITSTSKIDKAEPLIFNFQNSKKKINESLEHIPSAKLYEQEVKSKQEKDEPGKRKRVKSARVKDSKAKSNSKSK